LNNKIVIFWYNRRVSNWQQT